MFDNMAFISDAGHGWLKVPLAEVEPIQDKISGHSYKDDAFAYLEEDCDMYVFLTHINVTTHAAWKVFMSVVPEISHGDHSHIRNMTRFNEARTYIVKKKYISVD